MGAGASVGGVGGPSTLAAPHGMDQMVKEMSPDLATYHKRVFEGDLVRMMDERRLDEDIKKPPAHALSHGGSQQSRDSNGQESDLQVLSDLYDTTQGDGWTVRDGWKSLDLQTWWGVGLGLNQRVLEIKLIGNHLQGKIPNNLNALSCLERLSLQSNPLCGGPIPASLGGCRKLQTLNLSWVHLTGTIPAALGSLALLQELHLAGNRLKGPIPPQLGDLSALHTLNLSDNKLSGRVPMELGNLQKLTLANLANNKLTGVVPPRLGISTTCTVIIRGNSGLQMTYLQQAAHAPAYPMYLLPAKVLLALQRLPPHEELLAQHKLVQHGGAAAGGSLKLSRQRSSGRLMVNDAGQCAFVCHRWHSERVTSGLPPEPTPDDPQNQKLEHLKVLLGDHPEIRHLWLDYCCIPSADPASRALAMTAMPQYVQHCASFVVVARDNGQFQDLQQRAWCMLELLLAATGSKSPPADVTDSKPQEPAIRQLVSLWNSGDRTEMPLEQACDDSMGNPCEGLLTVEEDRAHIVEVFIELVTQLVRLGDLELSTGARLMQESRALVDPDALTRSGGSIPSLSSPSSVGYSAQLAHSGDTVEVIDRGAVPSGPLAMGRASTEKGLPGTSSSHLHQTSNLVTEFVSTSSDGHLLDDEEVVTGAVRSPTVQLPPENDRVVEFGGMLPKRHSPDDEEPPLVLCRSPSSRHNVQDNDVTLSQHNAQDNDVTFVQSPTHRHLNLKPIVLSDQELQRQHSLISLT